jgi:hypothetical protein
MKSLLLFASVFCFTNLYSQDSVRIKNIDSLVSTITHLTLPTQRDSIFQDFPGIGLSMKTYITVKTYGRELKMYSQIVKGTRTENQITKQEFMGSAFYYDQNKLIKVEELLLEEVKEKKAEWYFNNDNCFFHTLKSDKAEERIPLLLNMANAFVKKIVVAN